MNKHGDACKSYDFVVDSLMDDGKGATTKCELMVRALSVFFFTPFSILRKIQICAATFYAIGHHQPGGVDYLNDDPLERPGDNIVEIEPIYNN